jgi:hypothetical protein
MNYYTYWSILDSPSHTTKSNSICLVLALACAILWLLIKKYKKDNTEGDKIILLWATGLFSLLSLIFYITLTFFVKDTSDSQTLKMLDSPATPKVEGIVTNFQRNYRATRYGRETIESFTVDSVEFAYGDAAMGQFNSFSQTNNEIIFDGQKIRVTYRTFSPYGDNFNSILRLEVER